MAQGKVEICGVNTAKLPLLGSAEQELLLKEIKDGNENARIQFIEGNLRLVLSVIRRFSASTENMDDLFQIGCIGLIKSIDNFDLSLGVKFSTYAVPMIMGEIRRYLRDSNSIRVSRSLKDIAYKAISAREAMTKQTQKEPTIDEIATEIGIAKEDIVYALDAMQSPMSLNEPIYTAMQRLNEREHEIISLRFFEGKTQMEVANSIGISQAQVSRLEKNALRIMKNYLAG